jgi:hypothetical protein
VNLQAREGKGSAKGADGFEVVLCLWNYVNRLIYV